MTLDTTETCGNSIEFELDGRKVRGSPGETVLSVAKRYGIEIPALCYHEAVSAYGACRLCVVEAFWGKRSKLVTSCIYSAWPDERIETNTDRVRRTRRMVLEMLLARCPDAQVIRDLASEYGIHEARFERGAETVKPERCILCGLCVRVCAEVIGQSAIGYASRGRERIVTTAFGDQADECIGCAACVHVCPTGALSYEDVDGVRVMKELNTKIPLVRCRVCGEYFATEKQIARVQEKLSLPAETAATCLRCRARHSARTLREAASAAEEPGWDGVVELAFGLRAGPGDKE